MLSAGAETDDSVRRRFVIFATPVHHGKTRATACAQLATVEVATSVQNWSIQFRSQARQLLRTAFVLIGSASQILQNISKTSWRAFDASRVK